MTTTVRLTHVSGNKRLEVKVEGQTCGDIGPGESTEILLHSDMQLTVEETGNFIGHTPPEVAQPNATVDEANADANAYEGRRDLPPGAGNPGANVPDERVE